jgi:hypothetical protein
MFRDRESYYAVLAHDLRRAQLAVAEAAQGNQLALFATLHDDRRPPVERTASGRYLEPSLFAN